MNIAARTTRWTCSTAVRKTLAKTRPAAEADKGVKYWPRWSEQQTPAIWRAPEIHPALSLITVPSSGDRDRFRGKNLQFEGCFWSYGSGSQGLQPVVRHGFSATSSRIPSLFWKERSLSLGQGLSGKMEDGGRVFAFQMGFRRGRWQIPPQNSDRRPI